MPATVLGLQFVAALLAVPLLFAQTAQITGRVSDPQQAVLVGTEVIATNIATQVVRRTITNEQGLYALRGLPPGD